MKTCETCKHFTQFEGGLGDCESGKLLAADERFITGDTSLDIAIGGGNDGYGDFIRVGKDFGCIHHKEKHV